MAPMFRELDRVICVDGTESPFVVGKEYIIAGVQGKYVYIDGEHWAFLQERFKLKTTESTQMIATAFDEHAWIPHNSACGVMPSFPQGTLVDVKYRDGDRTMFRVPLGEEVNGPNYRDASEGFWRTENEDNDIVAWRLHKPSLSHPVKENLLKQPDVFKAGDKVVCKDADGMANGHLIEGQVYLVRGSCADDEVLWLEGQDNEWSWGRFQPFKSLEDAYDTPTNTGLPRPTQHPPMPAYKPAKKSVTDNENTILSAFSSLTGVILTDDQFNTLKILMEHFAD